MFSTKPNEGLFFIINLCLFLMSLLPNGIDKLIKKASPSAILLLILYLKSISAIF